MDRVALTQLVAMLVVLAAALRWLPEEDARNPLGMGDPQRALQMDATLFHYHTAPHEAAALELSPADAAAAYVRGSSRGFRQGSYIGLWQRMLRQVRAIQAEADEDTLVQLKGIVRNDAWPLMYYLYPVRHTFDYLESGSSADDPSLPEATHVIKANMQSIEDLTPEELKALQQTRDDRRGHEPGSGG